MKLITEFTDQLNLVEAKTDNDKKEYFIEGVFMQSNIKNRNGRVYPKEVMAEEVGRYVKEFVEPGRAFGELGHPDGPTINLDKVSHIISSLKEDGDNYVGRAKILSTPNGEIVKALINDGAKLGVSSRGLGSIEEKGGAQYVKNDFKLATAADIVADPSAPEAFVEGIYEGLEWYYERGVLKAVEVEQMRNQLREANRNELEGTKLDLWQQFVEKL